MTTTSNEVPDASGGDGASPLPQPARRARTGNELPDPTGFEATRGADEEETQRIISVLGSLSERERAFRWEQLRLLASLRAGSVPSRATLAAGDDRGRDSGDRDVRQWDYCYVGLLEGDGGYIVGGVSPNLEQGARIAEYLGLDALLTVLGGDGWELAAQMGVASKPCLVFKRPR
ncbi:MAG TPA: hypothetical protein VGP82_01600 [Ktedonobacterales bacterium]|nr:hypothetical protein [Ktedonobacterales bacterium]